MDLVALARTAAAEYASTGLVGAVVVAGSVGRAVADVYSDVELDVYWRAPPSDAQRLGVVAALGGEVCEFWPFDAEYQEWSETYLLQGREVCISGFLVDWVTGCIDDVIRRADPDLLKQVRLAALNDGLVLFGAALVERWRTTSRRYPRELAVAVAGEFLRAERLGSWHQRHALVARDDIVFLQELCLRVEQVVLGALCAVNGVLIEHPSFKWSARLIERLARAPTQLHDRLWTAAAAPPSAAVPLLDDLLDETLTIVERTLPEVDVDAVRHALRNPRRGTGGSLP